MDEREGKKSIRTVIWLLAANFLVSACIIGYLAVWHSDGAKEGSEIPAESSILAEQMETGEKYVLYIGTNDKDTYTQLIPTEEARDIVNAICTKYVDGYTISDAKGGWVDETDTLTQEHTLVYAFYEVTEEQLLYIMDEILTELNQNSILVEKQEAVYAYYSGK